MTGLILDFGGQRGAVCAALQQVLANGPMRVVVLPKAQESELAYQAFGKELRDALRLFAQGVFRSVQVHGLGSSTFVAGVYGPRFAGGVLEDWSGSVEGPLVEHVFFEELRRIEGLSYVALSIEESPDLEVPHVTNEAFPWSYWRLVAGAVRAEDGQWAIRRNSAIT